MTALTLLSSLIALTPTVATQQEPLEGTAPVETILPEEPVVVPLELSRGWPEVEVWCGDQGPFRMIVDTGAGVTVLGPGMHRALGLEPQGKTRVGDPTNPEAVEVDVVQLPSLFLGDAEFYEMTAIAWGEGDGMFAMGFDGIVGRPVFDACLLTLDYPAKELRVARGELPPADGRRVLAFEPRTMPVFDLEVEGRTVEAHFDSGNSMSLVLPGSLAESLTLEPGSESTGTGRRASGPIEFRGGVLEGTVRLGGLELERPQVRFDDSMPFANIGGSFLRATPVTIDLANGRMELAAVPAAAPAAPVATAGGPVERRITPPGSRSLGIGVARMGDGEPAVSRVVPGSLAERCGLRTGDVLLSVGGEPVTVKSDGPMARALAGEAGFTIRVRREGKELDVEIPGAE